MKVINLFGGPGSGKSSAMFGLAYLMKINGHRVEVNHEYVKGAVYEGTMPQLKLRQDEIFANQHKHLDIYEKSKQVDYVITDSPLILSTIYMPKEYGGKEELNTFILKKFNEYENINIFLQRPDVFQKEGRIHSEEESKIIDNEIEKFLHDMSIPYQVAKSNREIDKTLYGMVVLKDLKNY